MILVYHLLIRLTPVNMVLHKFQRMNTAGVYYEKVTYVLKHVT